jgi:hypothetical protein
MRYSASARSGGTTAFHSALRRSGVPPYCNGLDIDAIAPLTLAAAILSPVDWASTVG